MAIMDFLPLVGALVNVIMGKQAPYDASEAQLYAMKEMANQSPYIQAIQNATSPPLNKPFVLSRNGQLEWQAPIIGSVQDWGKMKASGDSGKYLTDALSKIIAGADTQLPNARPGIFG